jgi:hypothetical protein
MAKYIRPPLPYKSGWRVALASRPELLVHGAGVRANIFRPPAATTTIVDSLVERGRQIGASAHHRQRYAPVKHPNVAPISTSVTK